MRQLICCLTILSALLLGMTGCSREEVTVVNTFEQTASERLDGDGEAVLRTYYEMSDGTWRTDEYAYQYRLVVTGRLSHAEKDTTYTILSNLEEITFEQAWKASGLSSQSSDYFDPEDAVFVAIQ